MKAASRLFPRACLILAVMVMVSCATVPLTGRRTFDLVPNAEIISMADQQYAQIVKQEKVSSDPRQTAMVQRVSQRIARAAEDFMRQNGLENEIKNYQWQFTLFENPNANAWCLPGGKIGVYSGILPIAQDDNGLAVVIGHEVAHAIANHGNERMSQGLVAQLGGMGLSLALVKQPAATQQIFMQAYGLGANVGFLLPYSRIQESEGDRIGLVLMAMAGYNPNAAISLWERMNAAGAARAPEFLSTHPAPQTRIENIKKLIPEAMRYYRPQG